MGGRPLAAALVLVTVSAAVAQQSPGRLRSKDPAERLSALQIDPRIEVSAPTAATVLRLAAKDPHPQVRGQALRVLGAWVGANGPQSSRARDGAVSVLAKALTADSSWVRCGAADGLAAAGPTAVGARVGLLSLLDDQARFDAHPSALLALGGLEGWDGAAVEFVAGLLASDDPVIVGCAAWALGRQRTAALPATRRLADVFPPDPVPGASEPPPGDGGVVLSWLDLRRSVYGDRHYNIIFEGDGTTFWFAERDGIRYVRTIASSYNGPPPPPPPDGAARDPAWEQETFEHEALGWSVGFREIEVAASPDGLLISAPQVLGERPWVVKDDGQRLETTVSRFGRLRVASYGRIAPRLVWDEARELASTALVRICHGDEAAEIVADLLEHPARAVRSVALRLVTGQPASAASAAALLRIAASGDRPLSDLAARAFRSIPEGAGEVLRDAVLSDDPQLRRTAISLAGRMGSRGEPVATVLNEWLMHGGPMEDHEILRAIGELGPHGAPAVEALVLFVSEKRLHHENAIAVLGGIGPRARDALPIVIRFARERPGYGHGRLAAARALSAIDPDHPELPEFVVACCTDANDNVVEHTLMWVSQMNPPPQGTVEALLRLVRREKWETRRAAAAALGRLGRGRKDVSVVLAAMVDDDHQWVQVTAAEALHDVDPGHPRVVPVLRRLLRDANWNYRWHATMALEHVGPAARAALPDLRVRAADESEHGHVRRGARKAIEAIEASN